MVIGWEADTRDNTIHHYDDAAASTTSELLGPEWPEYRVMQLPIPAD